MVLVEYLLRLRDLGAGFMIRRNPIPKHETLKAFSGLHNAYTCSQGCQVLLILLAICKVTACSSRSGFSDVAEPLILNPAEQSAEFEAPEQTQARSPEAER